VLTLGARPLKNTSAGSRPSRCSRRARDLHHLPSARRRHYPRARPDLGVRRDGQTARTTRPRRALPRSRRRSGLRSSAD
jgi:hypothetical protein